jgi:hypothetical protein
VALFPQLNNQADFNGRAKGLRSLLEALRVFWITRLGLLDQDTFLVDTDPVPVMG